MAKDKVATQTEVQ